MSELTDFEIETQRAEADGQRAVNYSDFIAAMPFAITCGCGRVYRRVAVHQSCCPACQPAGAARSTVLVGERM